MQTQLSSYPATIEIEAPIEVARWRPLFHWFLGIPHIVVTYVLAMVQIVLSVISWFSIIFSARLPARIAAVQAMVLRYNARVDAYLVGLTSAYPPFDFTPSANDPGGSATTVDIAVALDNRSRLTTLFRVILIIPAVVYVVIIAVMAYFCWLMSALWVLFTGRWPLGLQRFLIGAIGVELRLGAYSTYLTDQYPPFSLRA